MNSKKIGMVLAVAVLFLVATTVSVSAQESECIDCHKTVTPNIVMDFQSGAMGTPRVQNPVASKMAAGLSQIGCENCHGTEHTTMTDFAKAKMPTPDTCGTCHAPKVAQFNEGKHSIAWAAMHAMPTTKDQPDEIIGGQKGCGGCHKIGTKTETGWEKYRYGLAGCDSCHTRHSFSTAEAHYGIPDPGAAAKIIETLNKSFDLKIDVKKLLEKEEEIRVKSRDLMKRTEESMRRMQKGQEQELPIMYG